MAVAGAVALTVGIGPPTSAQLQVVLARPPPRLLACLGKLASRKSRPKSCEHVVQDLARHGFPQLSLGKYVFVRVQCVQVVSK